MSDTALDAAFSALADPYRRRVVELLRERPARAGDLARAIRLPFPATSRHLRTLRAAGMVEEDRDPFDSRVRIYRIRSAGLAPLAAWLSAADAHWARQLESLQSHLDDQAR